MALWSWRTLPDGRVEVDTHDGAGWRVPTSGEHPEVARARERVLSWAPLAAEKAAKYGVPLSWILAVVYAESGGNPDADNAPRCGGTGCVGLMAIHWKVHGKSREAMLDPEQNLDYGTSLLAESRKRGYDLPAAASIHVAGGGTTYTPHSGTCDSAMVSAAFPEGSPWGYCEHMFAGRQGDGAVGYIDRVVRANNSFIEALADQGIDASDPWLAYSSKQAGVEPLAGRLAAFVGATALGYLAVSELSRRLRAR